MRAVEGHLTATILGTEQDLREELIAILENKAASRVQWFSRRSRVTQWQHIAAASSHPWLDELLPEELKDAESLQIDGRMTREANAPGLTGQLGRCRHKELHPTSRIPVFVLTNIFKLTV